jgi:hypothetical protein
VTEPLYPLHSGFGTVGGRPPKQQRRRQEANQDDYPQSHQTLPDPPNADKRFWFRGRICRSDLRRRPPCSTTHAGRAPVVESTYSCAKKAPGSQQSCGLYTDPVGPKGEQPLLMLLERRVAMAGARRFAATLPVVCQVSIQRMVVEAARSSGTTRLVARCKGKDSLSAAR